MLQSLSSVVEQYPNEVHGLFDDVDAALNQVLPGSTSHARYENASAVGLAIIVGRIGHPNYNPLRNPKPEPSFQGNNQATRPEVWAALPTDSEILGGTVGDIGRFTAFALAKLHNLSTTGRLSSYDPDMISIAPGRVGFAGGRRLSRAFIATSGLWEVHDHLVSGIVSEEISVMGSGERESKSLDELAEQFEQVVARTTKLQDGVAAADMTHSDLSALLPLVDDLPYDRL